MTLPQFNMRGLPRLILFGVLAFALFYALAFVQIYREKHAYVAASEWIFENVPPGSLISGPHWDDRLPLSIEGKSAPMVFRMEGPGTDLLVYERDTPQKIDELLDVVSKSDYIVFPTPRVQGSIPRIPDEYPRTTAFFQLLWSGKLGFTLAASFKTRPSLFGVSFNDDLADESFSVYDHPKVTIFRNTDRLSKDVLKQRISLPGQFEPLPTLNEILLTDSTLWTSAASQKRGWYHVVFALALLEVVAFSCFVLASSFFPFAPDRGWGGAKVMALMALVLPAWGLAVTGYGDGIYIGMRGLILGLSGALFVGALALLIVRPSVRQIVRETWRSYGKQAEIVFLGVFVLFFVLRSLTPDLAGSEKIITASLLNHLARTGAVPPNDPWAAGAVLHFPYIGLYLLGTASRAFGVPLDALYDFSAALVAGLAASTAYSLFLTFSTSRLHAVLVAGGVCIFESWQSLLEGFRFMWGGDAATSAAEPEVRLATSGLLYGELTSTVIALPIGALILFLLREVLLSVVHRERANLFSALLLGFAFGCLIGTSGADTGVYGVATVVITVATLVAMYSRDRTSVKIAAWKTVPAGAAVAIACSVISLPYLADSAPISVIRRGAVRAISLETSRWSTAVFLGWGALIAVLAVSVFLLRGLKWEYCRVAADEPIAPRDRRIYLVLPLVMVPWAFIGIATISGMVRPSWSVAIASSIVIFIAVFTRLPWRNETDEPFLRGLIIAAGLVLPVCEVLGVSAGGPIYDVTALTFAVAISVLVVWDRGNRSEMKSGRTRSSFACLGLLGLIVPGIVAFGMSARSLISGSRANSEANLLQSTDASPKSGDGEFRLVRWLNRTVHGDATLLLTPGKSAAQLSALTGLSILSAWIDHQSTRFQIGGDDSDRIKAVDQIYATLRVRQAYDLLMSYGVDLIVVGPTESKTYSQSGLQKFAGHTDLFAPIYDVDGVIVYAPAFSRFYPHE